MQNYVKSIFLFKCIIELIYDIFQKAKIDFALQRKDYIIDAKSYIL